MKEYYENRAKTYLPRRIPVIMRIDGKVFHTFTRSMKKPFDERLVTAMQKTANFLCENVQGCKMAYIQSDEISLLVTDYDDIKTDAWFGYEVQKMASVSASLATGQFNDMIYTANRAYFDSRVFSIPKEDVCNYFLWRQQDAIRNSIQSVAHAHFSHKELIGKKTNNLIQMLEDSGVYWKNLPTHLKRGSCVRKKTEEYNNAETSYIRKFWIIDTEVPLFNENRDYIEKLVYLYP